MFVIASASTVIGIVVGVLVLLAVLFFVGGYIVSGRRQQALRERLRAEIEAADTALAQARASDRGWERELIESAARSAFAQRHPGRAVEELHLVQVVDQPGTDADQAVFRVRAADGGEDDVTLGRREGVWVAQ